MRNFWFLSPLLLAFSLSVRAEPVADAEQQCPMLISQVESRLASSPPQDEESVEKARRLLDEAIQAEKEGDFKSCMSKIREAFKFLNIT